MTRWARQICDKDLKFAEKPKVGKLYDRDANKEFPAPLDAHNPGQKILSRALRKINVM